MICCHVAAVFYCTLVSIPISVVVRDGVDRSEDVRSGSFLYVRLQHDDCLESFSGLP